jgi:DNA-binding response OmpR family regulator
MRSQVVIADSDRMLLAVYKAFLAAEGFDAITVTNGLDCLEALKKVGPCLLVIDPDIPWGGGGIVAMMREQTDLPVVPVLFLTSRPEAVTEAVLPPSRYAILIKPVAPTTVASFVRTLAERPLIVSRNELVSDGHCVESVVRAGRENQITKKKGFNQLN